MRGAACKGGPYRDRHVPRRPISNTRHISHTRNSRSAALDTDLADPLVDDRAGRPGNAEAVILG